jgi:hypothetical protein
MALFVVRCVDIGNPTARWCAGAGCFAQNTLRKKFEPQKFPCIEKNIVLW